MKVKKFQKQSSEDSGQMKKFDSIPEKAFSFSPSMRKLSDLQNRCHFSGLVRQNAVKTAKELQLHPQSITKVIDSNLTVQINAKRVEQP